MNHRGQFAKYRLVVLSLIFVLAAVGAIGQANSNITGIVTDQTGAVVSGATITLTDPATGTKLETESGPSGLFVIGALNPANYNLKVSAKGFQALEQTSIVVNVSSTVRVDFKLVVGVENETVTVEATQLVPQVDSNVVS